MTTYEERLLMCEVLEAGGNNINKLEEIQRFIINTKDEYWLHIDEIRKMINELYESAMEELSLVNCMRENNIMIFDYESSYKAIKEEIDFVSKVKELFSLE